MQTNRRVDDGGMDHDTTPPSPAAAARAARYRELTEWAVANIPHHAEVRHSAEAKAFVRQLFVESLTRSMEAGH